MSLVGSLEDLGLGDILQIISLSRKSGVLYLSGKAPRTSRAPGQQPEADRGGTGESSGQGKGARVVFKNGQVISASLSGARKRLGELFVEKGLVSATQVREALRAISEARTPIRLDQALSKWFGADPGPLQGVIHSHIEEVVFGLFDWDAGDFNFDLKDDEHDLDTFVKDPQEPVLDGGLNPQFLAMEGARRRDERKRTGRKEIPAPLPGAVSEAAPGAPHPPGIVREAIVSRKVIIADDDPATLSNLERIITDMGYEAYPVGDVTGALSALNAMSSAAGVPVLVADLVMPKQDGKGMLGGLELLEEAKKREPGAPVLIITDIVDEDTERRVRELGGHAYLPKPRKSQVSKSLITPAIRDFGKKLEGILAEVVTGLPSAGPPAPASLPPPGEAPEEPAAPEGPSPAVLPAGQEGPAGEDGLSGLVEELKSLEGLVDFLPEEAPRPPSTPGLLMLKAMIDELINPRSHSDITLLILRFASELMNRAVLFLAKREEVCGLGQFGIVLEGDNPERRVRAMRIPVGVPSVFMDVLQRKAPIRKKPEETPWNDYIFDQLGGHRPDEVFLAPVFSGGRIVTVLYGDNAPEGGEIEDTTSLEIFLAQAGLALDRAFLERKLRDLKARDMEWIGD